MNLNFIICCLKILTYRNVDCYFQWFGLTSIKNESTPYSRSSAKMFL